MIEREGLDLVGSERDVLLWYLHKMRDAVVRTTEGLTDEDERRPGVPSGTNLLGVIRHLTAVENHWFQRVFLGIDAEHKRDDSMVVATDVTHDEIVQAYRTECARSDEVLRAHDLSALAQIANPGEDEIDSLRRIATHMIEETARHAGQCDVLREMIDGVTDD